jgi:hypothetical protein
MTKHEKLELVEAFEEAYNGIANLIAVLPDEALHFIPSIPDAWSTNDHLAHLLDADISTCFRLRVSMAQPGFAVPVWEEEEWHALLHYEAEDGRRCFELALGLRAIACASIKANIDLDWNEFWVHHPVRGKMGLIDLLAMYRDHGKTHEGYIKRNKEAWEAQKKKS